MLHPKYLPLPSQIATLTNHPRIGYVSSLCIHGPMIQRRRRFGRAPSGNSTVPISTIQLFRDVSLGYVLVAWGIGLLIISDCILALIGCGSESSTAVLSSLIVTCSNRSEMKVLTINTVDRNLRPSRSVHRNRMIIVLKAAWTIICMKSSVYAL